MTQAIAFLLLALGLVLFLASAVMERRHASRSWLGKATMMSVVAPAVITLWAFGVGLLVEAVLAAADTAARSAAVLVAVGAIAVSVAIAAVVLRWLSPRSSELASPDGGNVVELPLAHKAPESRRVA